MNKQEIEQVKRTLDFLENKKNHLCYYCGLPTGQLDMVSCQANFQKGIFKEIHYHQICLEINKNNSII